MTGVLSLLEKYIHVKKVCSFAVLLQVCIMVQLLPKGSEKSYPTSEHCKRTAYRIMGEGKKKGRVSSGQKIYEENMDSTVP
jgi:hypothetical protein